MRLTQGEFTLSRKARWRDFREGDVGGRRTLGDDEESGEAHLSVMKTNVHIAVSGGESSDNTVSKAKIAAIARYNLPFVQKEQYTLAIAGAKARPDHTASLSYCIRKEILEHLTHVRFVNLDESA
ncbi:MAG: hypothetical protein C4326_10855 [Ignavibacteria bacterium]